MRFAIKKINSYAGLAAFALVAFALVAVPSVNRLDTYRCAMTKATHFTVCCNQVEFDKTNQLRRVPRACCELAFEGTTPISSDVASECLVVPPALVASVLPLVPANARRVVMHVRPALSRGPPPPRLLTTSRFLI